MDASIKHLLENAGFDIRLDFELDGIPNFYFMPISNNGTYIRGFLIEQGFLYRIEEKIGRFERTKYNIWQKDNHRFIHTNFFSKTRTVNDIWREPVVYYDLNRGVPKAIRIEEKALKALVAAGFTVRDTEDNAAETLVYSDRGVYIGDILFDLGFQKSETEIVGKGLSKIIRFTRDEMVFIHVKFFREVESCDVSEDFVSVRCMEISQKVLEEA